MLSLAQLFTIASALLCTRLVAAVPNPIHLESRSVSPQLWNNLVLFEQYSAAAYCESNNDSPNSKIACAGSGAYNCPLVQSANTSSIIEFTNSLVTDVTGFVATDFTHGLTVVSFRGSRSIKNFITDVDFSFDTTDICNGCEVHTGFLESWKEARDGILLAVQTAAGANPGFPLILTGHSLGGALATLCAAELRNMGLTAALYTYGSPRVGNAAFATYVSNQPGGNYRVTHTNDPIPHLPLIAMGFQHVTPEYYIDSGNLIPVTAGNVKMLAGSNNLLGNTGQVVTDILSHLWYFNSITECGLFIV